MTIKTFLNMVKSNKIDHVGFLTGNDLRAEKVIYSHKSKKIYFNDKDKNAVIPPFKPKDIVNIARIKTADSNDYVFTLELSPLVVYKFRVVMKNGYTPYITNKQDRDNYNKMVNYISDFLDIIKGGKVTIIHTVESEMFSCYDEELDITLNPTTEYMIINAFDYHIQVVCGVPSVKMFDAQNGANFFFAMGVESIRNIHGNSDSNGFDLLLSGENGDYLIKFTD